MRINDPSTSHFAPTNNNAYIMGVRFDSGVGTRSHIQLFNPVGSGIVVYCDTLRVGHGGSSNQFWVRRHNTALATLAGNALNKNLGGPVATAEIRTEANAANLGDTPSFIDMISTTPLYSSLLGTPFRFDPPLRLEAGEGILFTPLSSNTASIAVYEWRELSV